MGRCLQVHVAARAKRMGLRRWAAETTAARVRNRRAATIRERQRLRLLHIVWQLWMSHWKYALRQYCDELSSEVSEAHAEQMVLQEELTAVKSQRSSDELLHLGIANELQRAAAEVAELTAELQEVECATKSMEEATLFEQRVSEERYAEAMAQTGTREFLAAQRDEQCALLEARFRKALAVPAALRDELRECEEQTEAAVAAEAEAKRTTMLLQRELENLHAVVPPRLKERSDEVVLLREHVLRARREVACLGEELAEQRLTLQIRDCTLEEWRREETHRELALFRCL